MLTILLSLGGCGTGMGADVPASEAVAAVPERAAPPPVRAHVQGPPHDLSVDCRGDADFVSIQAAIDAAPPGARILVAPCRYVERLQVRGRAVQVFGTGAPDATVVDGGGAGPVVAVSDVEDGEVRLAGMTLTGGFRPGGASAVEARGATLALDRVDVAGNAEGHAVVHVVDGALELVDVRVEDNVAGPDGQTIALHASALRANRTALDCEGGAMGVSGTGGMSLLESEVRCLGGVGVAVGRGDVEIRRSRIVGGTAALLASQDRDDAEQRVRVWNSALGAERGIDARRVTLQVVNSVVWGEVAAVEVLGVGPGSAVRNSVLLDATCAIRADRHSALDVDWTATWGNQADGCGLAFQPSVHAEPRFVSFPSDLRLAPTSPLLDAGDPGGDWRDRDGTRNDLGMFGGPLLLAAP